MDYNQIKKLIDIQLGFQCENLFVIVEDDTSLVLELKWGCIYFSIIRKEKGFYRLTYNKFDSKLTKHSETNITCYSHSELIERILNVVKYNLLKIEGKKSCKRKLQSIQ